MLSSCIHRVTLRDETPIPIDAAHSRAATHAYGELGEAHSFKQPRREAAHVFHAPIVAFLPQRHVDIAAAERAVLARVRRWHGRIRRNNGGLGGIAPDAVGTRVLATQRKFGFDFTPAAPAGNEGVATCGG